MLPCCHCYLLVLDGGDDAPRRAAGTNDVLVGNREEVALVERQLRVTSSHVLHVADHICVYG